MSLKVAMKVSALSYSRKGNIMDDKVPANYNRTAADLKSIIAATSTLKYIVHNDQHLEAIPQPVETDDNSKPMMCQSYLSSPLETILESLNDHDSEYISLHDLIEAYNVLSERIRAEAYTLVNGGQYLLAFALLKEHASSLARALRRDIQRALIDPSRDLRRTPPPGESFLTDVSMNDHEIQHARDLPMLCHHSLCVLSDVFAFEALHSLFDGALLSLVLSLRLMPLNSSGS